MKCWARLPVQPLVDQFLLTNDPPTCAACGGPLKHATISFGQPLDTNIWKQAEAWMREADLVLSLGSSLVVHPAAALPEIASASNARLVIINREPTPLDALADLVLNRPLGPTLTAIDEELGLLD